VVKLLLMVGSGDSAFVQEIADSGKKRNVTRAGAWAELHGFVGVHEIFLDFDAGVAHTPCSLDLTPDQIQPHSIPHVR